MNEQTAVDFLHKKTGLDNKNAAKELANALGYLPLALEQAGAFIKVRGKSYEEYLKLFTERKEEILKRGDNITDYEKTVYTTWDVSREKLKEESGAGALLLNLCCFFAPDDIPLDIIRKERKFLPKPLQKAAEDNLTWDDMLQAIKRYSLATIEKEELSLHRLLQSVMRHKMTKKDQKKFAGIAVKLLCEAYPFNDDQLDTWEESGRLLPHTTIATTHTEELLNELEMTAKLIFLSANYLRIRAEFKSSRKLFERALIIGEKVYGKESLEVANYSNDLGIVCKELGDFNKATKLYERALKIGKKLHESEHYVVAAFLNNFGLLQHELGDSNKAKQLYEQALKINKKKYGEKHPNIAFCLNNLGELERELGNFIEAKEYYHDSLEIFGIEHPVYSTVLNNLGLTEQKLGNFEIAKELYQKALEIDKKNYGIKHPSVAYRLNNLATLFFEEGNIDKSEEFLLEALDIFTKTHGSDHPHTKHVRDNLEDLLSNNR